MRKYFYVLTLAFVAAVAAFSSATATRAQTPRVRAANAQATDTQAATTAVLASLPASDAVMLVDVRRLLSDGLPRAYNNNPAELARVNAEIDKFKATTGFDARSFERVAVGVSYVRTPTGKTLVETVAVARGKFNTAALVAAARPAASNRMHEEKYAGKTIYVFKVDSSVKLLGLFSARLSDVAAVALDANTLAVGKLERVRASIDAHAGRGRVSPDITALATRDANALVGAGGNIPAWLTQNLDIGGGNLSRSIASVRQFYSTLGATTNGFNILTALRTENAGAAKTLSSTLTSLKSIAPFAIGQMPAPRARPLQSVVENTKVGAEGNDVLITLQLSQVDLAALIDAF
ncbi:MAG TPA: hypothetical protein VEX70_00245 [Pyrinomonadaceae bacterium]|nr:hypothetical protein [Pyrinomonadaceae bacterium]